VGIIIVKTKTPSACSQSHPSAIRSDIPTGCRPWRNLDATSTLPTLQGVNELLWYVAHTRPRREKKLVEYARREGLFVTLPCYSSAHKYRGKTATFEKPLFPGYVFFRLLPSARPKVYQSDYVANLLDVPDQTQFEEQLAAVQLALASKLEIQLAPEIGKGKQVRIIAGPLRGVEGWVEERFGMSTVLLRVDFLSQAAAVKIEADCLELI
jgi:transcriptional antiterminator RfaH